MAAQWKTSYTETPLLGVADGSLHEQPVAYLAVRADLVLSSIFATHPPTLIVQWKRTLRTLKGEGVIGHIGAQGCRGEER
jgi:hypothetical protein